MMRRVRHVLRRFIYALPAGPRSEFRALRHSLLIASRRFRCEEPEWQRLQEWLGPGDVAIDVGANVGYYTWRLSELVGPTGHVIAIEPLHESFCALARNAQRFRHQNVTLLNVAASNAHCFVKMSAPTYEPGLARLDRQGTWSCLAMLIDSLAVPGPVRLVKIDVEGHELQVLKGMEKLLSRDRPVIIFEARREAAEFLVGWNYSITGGCSPNLLATPQHSPTIPSCAASVPDLGYAEAEGNLHPRSLPA